MNETLIAVVGATGQQGGAVVRALRDSNKFTVRALSRNPGKHRGLADEVVEANLDRPETLSAAFKLAYGVFLVTNFWQPGADEVKQATAAVRAAKEAGVTHFIWSTLPDVEAISSGRFNVPHFTGKARVDPIVNEAGFLYHTFVVAPSYYQNLVGALAPQRQADGSMGWAVLLIQLCVAFTWATFANSVTSWPEHSHIQIWQDMASICHSSEIFLSFNDIVDTLNRQGHLFSVTQVSREVFATQLPAAAEVAETFGYFQAHTYLGSDWSDRIALANKIAGRQPTNFAAWARMTFSVRAA
jgi:uncharacterized protein YbjT (DUF2867 family)